MTGIERLNMPETGPQITPPDASVSTGKGAGAKPPEQFRSPLYDPKREDYLVQKEGREVVVMDPKLVDPNTKENLVVRRVPEDGGGSGLTPEEIAADRRELERLYTDDPDTLDLLKELSPEDIHDRLHPKSPGQDTAPANTSPDTNVADAVDDQAGQQPNQVAEDPSASSQGRGRWGRAIDWVTRTTSSAHQPPPDQNQPGVIREGNQRASRPTNTPPDDRTNESNQTNAAQGKQRRESRDDQRESSVVSGMTEEEVQLFLENGITIEQLKVAEDRPDFRMQIDRRLAIFRAKREEEKLTPEQKAKRDAEARDKRIKELEAEKANLPTLPENTDDLRRLKLFSRMRIDEELSRLKGGEGPPKPPVDKSMEYEASSERGKQVVKEIVRLEALRAGGKKLSQDQRKELNNLYLQHEIHMEAVRIVSLRVNRSERRKAKQDGPRDSLVKHDHLIDSDTGMPVLPLTELVKAYEAGRIDRGQYLRQIDVYFGEAKRVGLLRDLDQVLLAAWQEVKIGIGRKQNSSQLMPRVEEELRYALASLNDSFIDRQLNGDSEIIHLAGIGQIYVQFAKQRFSTAIRNGDKEGLSQRKYEANEFNLNQEIEENTQKETFWQLEHGWYIKIYAQTEEEFMIAVDSYISGLESITSDAKKITQEASQFIDVLAKSEGAKRLKETNPTFISELIYGIEARVGVFGADDNNERYNGEDYKAFLDFINKDGKGPDRYLTLLKMLDGRIAATLWELDKDPRWEILFATYGSMGQLAHSSISQRDRSTDQGIFNQTYKMLIEEIMGVQIVNKGDVGKLTQFMSDDKFIHFFDGLYKYDPNRKQEDYGDTHIIKTDKSIARLIRIEQDLAAHIAISKEDKDFYERVKNNEDIVFLQKRALRLIRIEKDLAEHGNISEEDRNFHKKAKDDDKDLTSGLRDSRKLGRIQEALRNGEKLEESDKKFYDQAWTEAKKAVDIAFQIYGTFGEKSKRAGGVFKTDVKIDDEGKKFRYFVPIHWAEKHIQFGVTMTKMKYDDDAEIWNKRDGYKKWNDATTEKIKAENKKRGENEWANFKAQYRTAKAEECRDRNIVILKRDGFEAMVVDDNGQLMKLKRPKEDSNAPDGLARDIFGDTIPEEVDVDYYTATHHAYANWSGHTYWSYQEEHRHLLLSPKMFKEARQIRESKLRPEDADPVVVQLLILDPTLNRVRRFEEGFEDRERKLVMAAVEDSYLTHWDITDELYRAFWPKYGTPPEEIGIYYGLQDYGGYRKTLESMRARFAEDPERFMRRGRRLLPDLHNPVSAFAEYWGQGNNGALGAIRMMGYPMYRLAGTFALDKAGASVEAGGKMSDYLGGYKDREGNYVEGLLLKLTNNSDKLAAVMDKIPLPGKSWKNPKTQNEFCYALMESLGRLQKYLHLFTVMETQIRNASGALDLRNIDILTDSQQFSSELTRRFDALPKINWVAITEGSDLQAGEDASRDMLANYITQVTEMSTSLEDMYGGMFNRQVIDESESPNTGSGRHRGKKFHNIFGHLLIDAEQRDAEKKLPTRGGPELYPGEKLPYSHIFDKIIIAGPRLLAGPIVTKDSIWDFIFGKFVPT